MLADRGGCSFVTKVRNMENIGAAVAIVIDNSSENIEDVVMSDDGSGAGIHIPSMLISKRDGKKLIDFLKTATQEQLEQIQLLAEFTLKNDDNRVEYDLWLSSSSDNMLDFIQDFSKFDLKMKDQVLMTPHYSFWECQNCDEKFVFNNCLSSGRYCAHDPVHDKLSGREIIFEDLRQMCIYKMYYEENKKIWWDYMKVLHRLCYGNVNIECSDKAHKEIGIDASKTKECMVKSFSQSLSQSKLWQSKDTLNFFIEDEMAYMAKYGPSLFPGIVINNQTYRGQLEIEQVTNAVCAGF